jgi:plastocyanin
VRHHISRTPPAAASFRIDGKDSRPHGVRRDSTQRRTRENIVIAVSRIPVIAALGVGLTLAGCGGDDKSSSPAPPPPPAATSEPSSGAAQKLALAADSSGALKFDKTALTAKAGKVEIVMTNPSSTPHDVGVDGNGVDKDGPVVQGGKTSTVTVDLKAGTYAFYCSVGNHRAEGMKGTLTVR